MLLILAVLNSWHAYQVDFVSAFPQADVECTMYVDIPKGYQVPNGHNKDYCLKLLKNLYGKKQAGRVWNKHLHKHLISRGFSQSKVDECIYTKGELVFAVYVDDEIVFHHDKNVIELEVKAMKELLDMTSNEGLADYIGVNISYRNEGKEIHLTQPKLVNQILKDLGLNEDSNSQETPSQSHRPMNDIDDQDFKEEWDYRSVIGKLNFLEKSTRPDIAFAVHQCARFQSNLKKTHGEAVKHIGRYLLGTKDRGLIYKPTNSNKMECYVDADFCGNRDATVADKEVSTAKSRTGYIILYCGCPILWASKLQSVIALSTTEAELVALSTALRDVIPMIELMKELQQRKVINTFNPPQLKCKVFEDNSGALEIATVHKTRPRTKHMNVRYHHF